VSGDDLQADGGRVGVPAPVSFPACAGGDEAVLLTTLVGFVVCSFV
jgi:hypothetical protein